MANRKLVTDEFIKELQQEIARRRSRSVHRVDGPSLATVSQRPDVVTIGPSTSSALNQSAPQNVRRSPAVNEGAGPSGLQAQRARPSSRVAQTGHLDLDAQLIIDFEQAMLLSNNLAALGNIPPPPSPELYNPPEPLTKHNLETRFGVASPESMYDYRIVEAHPRPEQMTQQVERGHYREFLLSAYTDFPLLSHFTFNMISAMYNFSTRAESRLREMWNDPEPGSVRTMLLGYVNLFRKLRTILWNLLMKKMETLNEDENEDEDGDVEMKSSEEFCRFPPPKYTAPPPPSPNFQTTPKRLYDIEEDIKGEQEEEEKAEEKEEDVQSESAEEEEESVIEVESDDEERTDESPNLPRKNASF